MNSITAPAGNCLRLLLKLWRVCGRSFSGALQGKPRGSMILGKIHNELWKQFSSSELSSPPWWLEICWLGFFSTLSIKAEIQLCVSRTCKLERLAEITGVRNPFQFHLEAHGSCLHDSRSKQCSIWRRCPESWDEPTAKMGCRGVLAWRRAPGFRWGLACLARGPQGLWRGECFEEREFPRACFSKDSYKLP